MGGRLPLPLRVRRRDSPKFVAQRFAALDRNIRPGGHTHAVPVCVANQRLPFALFSPAGFDLVVPSWRVTQVKKPIGSLDPRTSLNPRRRPRQLRTVRPNHGVGEL